MSDELIRPVPGYDGYYADAYGSIWSTISRWQPWRKLSPILNNKGYVDLRVRRNGALTRTMIHKMVALAWHGIPAEGLQVRHLDGLRTNTAPDNLAWGTVVENMLDRKRHGTLTQGMRSGSSKLTDAQVLEIHSLKGKVSATRASAVFPVSESAIRKIWRGITWAHLKGKT